MICSGVSDVRDWQLPIASFLWGLCRKVLKVKKFSYLIIDIYFHMSVDVFI